MPHEVNVTGVLPDPDHYLSTTAHRREINDLVGDEKQFSLYIQALQELMKVDQPKTLSWFSIAGIHGLPYEAWDSSFGTQKAGYCTHGSNLFPTWHRAYIALFEQALQAEAVKIAKDYKDDEVEWMKAAICLRSPYWDWASNIVPPDEVIRKETVNIVTASGPKDVPNPLYSYSFHPIHPSFSGLYSKDTGTVRCPARGSASPRKSRPDALVAALQSYDAREETYDMLTLIKNWNNFSNHTYAPQQGAVANSLEAIHDNIHGIVGGGGHMGNIAYAAFDPIFWLHHTNVDRVFALWQALNPDVWVSREKQKYMSTFTIPPDSWVDEHTELTPFWNGDESFWKSAGAVREWTQFNSEYPEFAGLKDKTPTERRKAILDIVKKLYGPTTPFQAWVAAGSGAAAAAEEVKSEEEGSNNALSAQVTLQAAEVEEKPDITDWFVRVRSGRFALSMTYTILLFLGEPPEDESEYRTSPNIVGYHTVFVSTHVDQCSNCIAQRNNRDEGIVNLTPRLKNMDYLTRSDEQIDAYLGENLKWRIQKIDGSVVPPEEVDGLEIAVMTVPLVWSKEDEIYELPEDVHPTHHNLTFELPGGRTTA